MQKEENFLAFLANDFASQSTHTLHLYQLNGNAIVSVVAEIEPTGQVDQFCIVYEGDPLYPAACEMVREQYSRHFNCELDAFYPSMFCLVRDDKLVACCGFRSADGEAPLFLEQYLEGPIESLIEGQTGVSIDRRELVEIGGFAVDSRAEALPFMVRLAPAFKSLGFEHATCTVTTPVQKCLRKLGIPFISLASASPASLTDKNANWGEYYSLSPMVLAGAIQPAINHLMPLLELL